MKKKSACILLVFAVVIVLTYMTGESYYRGISEKAGLDEQEEKIYKYQYDMIVDLSLIHIYAWNRQRTGNGVL